MFIAFPLYFCYSVYTMFIIDLWNTFLYEPLFNALIWAYNNWTDQNLGWAVVYLTVIFRLALLPFSLIDEYKQAKNAELYEKIEQTSKDFKNDPIQQKQEIRRLLRQRKVSPWAKAIVLGFQVLAFLLIYQVFVNGVKGERVVKILYPSVDFPGIINTMFYGFDLAAKQDVFWSGAVALLLFGNIYLNLRKRKYGVGQGDLAYLILFPLATFLFLFFLPMVKSLFILTTTALGIIIHQFSQVIFRPQKKKS